MNAKPIDIRPCDLAIVQEILRKYLLPEAKVWVFGSRATWTTKDSSDLDLAIDAGHPLTREESSNLVDAFDESSLPYKVDIADMHNINDTFKAIIERDMVGLELGNDWPIIEIDQVCNLIVDCVNKTAPVVLGPTPFRMIRTTNIRNGRVNLNGCKFVDQVTYEKWTRRAKLLFGDV